MIINVIIILLLIGIIGFLLGGEQKLLFIKATSLSFLLILTSYFSVIVSIIVFIFIESHLIDLGNNLFIVGLITILASGIIEFFIVKLTITRLLYDLNVLVIVEYFIQWMLIYLTLYQFISQSLNSINWGEGEIILNQMLSTDINTLSIILLPVFMISWIAIAMNKVILENKSEK